MLFQIPDTMPAEHYRAINIDGFLNLYLFIAFAAILIVFGIIFLFKARKQEVEGAKRIQMAFGIFGIMYGMTRVFFILMFQDFTNPDQNYNLLAGIAYSFGMIGFTSIIWALERIKYKKRFFFLTGLTVTLITIVGTVIIALGFTEIRTTVLTIIFIGTPVSALLIFILYIGLIKNSTGIVRKKSLYSFIGLVIMFIGIIMDSQFILANDAIPLWFKMDIVPLICIAGYLMFAITQL